MIWRGENWTTIQQSSSAILLVTTTQAVDIETTRNKLIGAYP
jgi:hypothetical protein